MSTSVKGVSIRTIAGSCFWHKAWISRGWTQTSTCLPGFDPSASLYHVLVLESQQYVVDVWPQREYCASYYSSVGIKPLIV